MSYREHAPPPPLASLLACTRERTVDGPHLQHVVPDGCVDLIWIAGRGLHVAGPDTAPQPDPLVTAAARALEHPAARVADLVRELAISERQLRRRCEAAVGYGPKTLARILRFQRLLRLAAPGRALAELALGAGYADQAHMTAEVTRLAGRSSVRFLKDGGRPAA